MRLKFSQYGTPPNVIHAVDFIDQNIFSIETAEIDDNPFDPSFDVDDNLSNFSV